MLGNAIVVDAGTPICGGNHSFSTVGSAGIDMIPGTATIHNHDGKYLCHTYMYYDRYLQRCACGAETVWVDKNSPKEHHEKINLNE
ncbi:MAG: hypothetical protein HFH80_02065 [Lachnospiraceae bacterium]|nr:hypothetical protein [Lachnospiraceae bacterium]